MIQNHGTLTHLRGHRHKKVFEIEDSLIKVFQTSSVHNLNQLYKISNIVPNLIIGNIPLKIS